MWVAANRALAKWVAATWEVKAGELAGLADSVGMTNVLPRPRWALCHSTLPLWPSFSPLLALARPSGTYRLLGPRFNRCYQSGVRLPPPVRPPRLLPGEHRPLLGAATSVEENSLLPGLAARALTRRVSVGESFEGLPEPSLEPFLPSLVLFSASSPRCNYGFEDRLIFFVDVGLCTSIGIFGMYTHRAESSPQTPGGNSCASTATSSGGRTLACSQCSVCVGFEMGERRIAPAPAALERRRRSSTPSKAEARALTTCVSGVLGRNVSHATTALKAARQTS